MRARPQGTPDLPRIQFHTELFLKDGEQIRRAPGPAGSLAHMDETKKVYHDVLGFTVEGETKLTADATMHSLAGLSKAEVSRSRVDRKPLHMKTQDRGAARLPPLVQDTGAVLTAVKAAGMRAMSTEGREHFGGFQQL